MRYYGKIDMASLQEIAFPAASPASSESAAGNLHDIYLPSSESTSLNQQDWNSLLRRLVFGVVFAVLLVIFLKKGVKRQ